MKKNIIIAVLSVVSVVSIISLYQMSSKASYWMKRCDYSEQIVNQVLKENPDYSSEVLMEGEAWTNWALLVLKGR